jgi:MFS family permease
VNPVVWKLGFTSLLTDISAEMVNSILPVYVVLHLHMSPLQYGAIDAVYNGMAVTVLSLAGGVLADRTGRYKEIAAAGYGISAICKPLLLAAGGAWGWITVITALDRTGKGFRTAPRDSLLSLHSAPESLASAFAVHRALDAGGSLIGPIVAFALLSRLPGAFDAVWVTSSVFALLGLAVLWLFVDNPRTLAAAVPGRVSLGAGFGLLLTARFGKIAMAGAALSVATVSDGFLYLLLQRGGDVSSGLFPLFFVVTAATYMLLSVPVGYLADAWGRGPVLLSGYCVLGAIYIMILLFPEMGMLSRAGCLVLLGLYYAATEGVLMAMSSAVIPVALRATGLAVLATLIGVGKMSASLIFGWLWERYGASTAVPILALLLAGAVVLAAFLLRKDPHQYEELV